MVRRRIESMVDHRVDQYLQPRPRALAVASHQGETGSQVAARAVAGHCEAFAVAVDVGSVLGAPAQRSVTILQRSGKLGFGSKPIPHRYNNAAGMMAQRAA